MSKTKAGGSTKNGRDSVGKRLGVKLFGGQMARPGDVIIRQRGSRYGAGKNVGVGSDYTLFAKSSGEISYSNVRRATFTGRPKRKTIVSVIER